MARAALLLLAMAFSWLGQIAHTQDGDDPLRVATVTRPPFSMPEGEAGHSGFSIELFSLIAAEMGREVEYVRHDTFVEMLAAVEAGEVDAAVSNISITSEREARMDFSQPIFRSGLRIMLPFEEGQPSLLSLLLTRQIGLLVLSALGLLFVAGLAMWAVERKRQPYFDRPMPEALFPSFWWALNLVVNGGFEERMPQSRLGRVFGVILIVASLFIVSIFVAQITAATTVQALSGAVDELSDLEGRQVGTIESATAADFLTERGLAFRGYDGFDGLIADFEAGALDAVVFDSPILAYYTQNDGYGVGKLLDRLYQPENYGIALPNGSPILDEINQSLLRLRENGAFDDLSRVWFGAGG